MDHPNFLYLGSKFSESQIVRTTAWLNGVQSPNTFSFDQEDETQTPCSPFYFYFGPLIWKGPIHASSFL